MKLETVLEIEDLTVRFHTRAGVTYAVNGITYSVRGGETIGVVGESGCGKTVSVLSLLQLLPQDIAQVTGSAIFMGRDLLSMDRSELRKVRGRQIALIFQDPMTSLNPVLTIGSQLAEPMRVHQGATKLEAMQRAEKLLELVGIPEAGRRLADYPHQFSGGMRQRAAIAMALACNPKILIADEPTTALDVTIQAQIVKLVKELRDQFGMSLIWITHDLGVVAGLADRVIVIYAGYVVEEADVESLYASPAHPYTAALLRSLPRVDERGSQKLTNIGGSPPDLNHLPAGCPFAPRCDYVQPICREQMPPRFSLTPSHQAACWVDLQTEHVRQANHYTSQVEGG